MKLLYIVNARIPTEKAHGVQIMKMCEAFTLQGIEVTLAVPRRFGVAKLDPFSYYKISSKFKIKYLPIIDTYTWGYFGFILGSCSFAITSYLYGLMQKGKDGMIFYSRDQDQFSFFPFSFSKSIGLTPSFFEVHGLKKPDALHSRLFKQVQGIIATNSFIKSKLTENFQNLNDKVALMPNGVEIGMFKATDKKEARQKLGLPQDKKIVVYVGHFYAWKGVDTLIKAAEVLQKDGAAENILIYMVGGNQEETDRLKKEISHGSQLVTFAGHKPYSEIPLVSSAADALVITGTAKDADSVHYTSPIKLFEYMASERPVIAIDSPAIRDIVSTDEVSFYKADDAQSLAAVIRSTLEMSAENTAIQNKRIENMQKKVQEYSWQKRAEKIISFIQSKLSA